MEIKLHSNASTTPRTRKYIRNSTKSDAKLANELGISPDTVKKWRSRNDFLDKSHRPNVIHRRLTFEQEWLIVYLRTRLTLSLDELLEVSKLTVNRDLSRAVLNRCLKKYSVPRVKKPVSSQLGHVIVDMVKLPELLARHSPYLLLFTEAFSSYISFALAPRFDSEVSQRLVDFLTAALPYKIKAMTIPKHPFMASLAGSLNVPYHYHDKNTQFSIKMEGELNFQQDIVAILEGEYFDERLGFPSTLLCYEDLLNKRVIRNRLKNLTPNGYFKK